MAGPGSLEPFCVVRSIELTQKRRRQATRIPSLPLSPVGVCDPGQVTHYSEPRFLHLYNGDDSHIKHVSTVFTPMTAESLKYLTQRYCILRKMKSNCFRGFSSRYFTGLVFFLFLPQSPAKTCRDGTAESNSKAA